MNGYDTALWHFTGDDECRTFTHKPFPDGEYIIATDLHALIRVRADKCEDYRDAKRMENCKYPSDFGRIFPDADCDIVLPLSKLVQAIKSLPETEVVTYKPHERECYECNGRGEVEFTYTDSDDVEHGHYFDCPLCDGKGYLLTEEVERDEMNVSINGQNFLCLFIKQLAEAIHAIGKTEAHVLHIGGNGAMLVRIEDGVDVVIMPNILKTPRATINLD